MCCSAWPAVFSRTITGTWEVLVDGRLMQVLWYQNKVGHGNTSQDVLTGKGNCLIIPLLGKWESIRLLNTYNTPKLLDDISNALAMPKTDDIWAASLGVTPLAQGGMVFLQFDIYDIVLAENPSEISSVLSQIRPEKRPQVNEAVFDLFERWYGCPVALCCFNDSQAGNAKPLGFAFEPLYPDRLVVYALDGHDGNPPDPSKLVMVDHDIFVGSYLMKAEEHATISYSDDVPDDLRPYLLKEALGVRMRDSRMENGDFVFKTDLVRKGFFQGVRSLPPLAPADIPRMGHMATRQFGYNSAR